MFQRTTSCQRVIPRQTQYRPNARPGLAVFLAVSISGVWGCRDENHVNIVPGRPTLIPDESQTERERRSTAEEEVVHFNGDAQQPTLKRGGTFRLNGEIELQEVTSAKPILMGYLLVHSSSRGKQPQVISEFLIEDCQRVPNGHWKVNQSAPIPKLFEILPGDLFRVEIRHHKKSTMSIALSRPVLLK